MGVNFFFGPFFLKKRLKFVFLLGYLFAPMFLCGTTYDSTCGTLVEKRRLFVESVDSRLHRRTKNVCTSKGTLQQRK